MYKIEDGKLGIIKNRKIIIDELLEVGSTLSRVLYLLEEENRDGSQYNRANFSRLGGIFDEVDMYMNKISDVINCDSI